MSAQNPKQTLVWTALPHGRTGGVLRLSVLLSPRLVSGTDEFSLSMFPDFVSWPDLVNHLGFDVGFRKGTAWSQFPATRVSQQVDLQHWKLLFTGSTLARSHAFTDLSARKLRSFPVRAVRQTLRDLYTEVARSSPASQPSLSSPVLSTFIGKLGRLHDHRQAMGKKAEEALDTERVLKRGSLHGFSNETQLTYWQVNRFFERPSVPDQVPESPKAPALDFHQLLAALAGYPDLLRLFGLVIDLEVKLEPGQEPPASSEVQVLPRWGKGHEPAWLGKVAPEPSHTDVSLRTRYQLSGTDFLAEPRAGGGIADGMLRLDSPEFFETYQVDVDGAALKTYDFAHNMHRMQQNPGHLTPGEAGLPVLRSSGFTVARLGRAERLQEGLVRARNNNTALSSGKPQDVEPLRADELIRGYRIDILDETSGEWSSLHARTGAYSLGAGLTLKSTDLEGFIRGASASTAPAGEPDLYLHEAMFGWEGWSLSVPRPGRAIVPVPNGKLQGEELRNVENEAGPGLPLEPHFQVTPGTLPRLRYGRRYRIRARVVDLAGNSKPVGLPDATHATAAQIFYRYEPVPPPVLVPRARISEGESLEHLVIRSDLNVPAGEYGQRPHVQKALEALPYVYLGTNERHVVPPKTSQLMAELHGKFEEAMGPGKDAGKWFNLAVKEEGTLADQHIVDTSTGEASIEVPGLQLITPPGVKVPPDRPLPQLPLKRGDALAPGQYLLHTEEKLRLPYLPDVFARGVSFLGLPGVPAGQTFLASFDTAAWPEVKPFRLCIEEGTGEPVPAEGVLTVQLPKATMATVRYSSHLSVKDLEQMGIWALLDEATRNTLRKEALEGRHWMLTPYRELVLVHAVQRPLEVPSLYKLKPLRLPGETSARFEGHLQCHSHSTGRIAVEARWSETVDPLSEEGPRVISGAARVADFDIGYEEGWLDVEKAEHRMLHPFGDTKYRRVEYFGVATTRYREYFHPAITREPANITLSGKASPEAWQLDIPNSARPAAPEVLYVVPTFGWEKKPQGSALVSTRRGGGLRVYLKRPWYSSGDGERLAVLLWTSTAQAPKELEPFITGWGVDPLWGPSGARPACPPVTGFTLATETMGNLSLEEVPGQTVTAAGHQVEYDPARQLWFCDIVIDPGQTYTPFIRLALARLQPNSVPGAHLSRVVLTDFVQLMPDRTARLEFITSQRLNLTVSGVSGVNDVTQNMASPRLEASRVVRIRLEEPLADVPDELQWGQVGEEVTLQATPRGNNLMSWQGELLLAKLPKSLRGTQRYRILVQEFDVLRTDPDPKVYERFVSDGGKQHPVRERLVYADAFEL